jgi:exonuclease VII small subunit
LEVALETRDKMLADSAREVERATTDITAMRETLRAVRQELQSASSQAQKLEKADIEALKSIRASLLKILEPPVPQGTGS